MDDDEANEIRSRLDEELQGVHANNGIAFGLDLFEEFRKREWFTLETFGLLGTGLFTSRVPAYNRTHFVFSSWGLPTNDFVVGQNADRT